MTNNHGRLIAALLRRWFLLWMCGGLLVPGALRAAPPVKAESPEDKALKSAQALFDDQQYSQAEARLASFLATYTNSAHRPYAILYLARSRFGQSNYNGAIQLLTNAMHQAGPLAGEYVFWTASARLEQGDFAQAGEGFASFVKIYADSPRQLEAAYDQAEAYSKMETWALVTNLLQKPDGVFNRLAAADPKNSFAMRGRLLLAEALSAVGKYKEAEKVVGEVDSTDLEPEWQWRRQYLLCRLELADGQPDAAWQNSSNLLDAVVGQRHQAASRYLRGEILEALGRISDALQSYTNNLDPGLPAPYQRQALLKVVTLILAQHQTQDAVQLLENYVIQRTNGAALDLARLSLGELYLKIYYNPGPADQTSDYPVMATNFLQEAQTNFERVIQDFPASSLVPQARLDRGWCYWAQTNMPAARADFQVAADHLRPSPEQAVALFKLADTEFYQKDYGAALTNYNSLLRDYAGDESVTNELFDRALYQIVETSLARKDEAGAQAAVRKILDWYPNSLFGARGKLLIGENQYDYATARRTFSDVLTVSPQTPIRAEVEFAIARTYEQEGNWPEARRQYESWLNRHGTNAPLPLQARVNYSLALVYGKAGMDTNALVLFTNFVARFPSNNLAAWAQNWVADYYFNQGDYQLAEQNYDLLQTLPDAGDLGYEARLMAGRAALAGQRAVEARAHFSDLVAITNAPPDLRAEGLFALGDAIMQQFRDNPTNATFFTEAITAFGKLTNGVPTNAIAIQACGKLGDCWMYWADVQWESSHDPQIYTNAVPFYQTVLSNFSGANLDAATRSQAEVALGHIAERQGQPGQALEHYCNVLYDPDPDQCDPYWVEQAGKSAARLYEQQQQWPKAIKVYQRVLKAVPSLRAPLEKAIIEAQSAADKSRN